jgi:hypothetical protein
MEEREPDTSHGEFHSKEVKVSLGNRVENIQLCYRI